jgi:hypothetical protein
VFHSALALIGAWTKNLRDTPSSAHQWLSRARSTDLHAALPGKHPELHMPYRRRPTLSLRQQFPWTPQPVQPRPFPPLVPRLGEAQGQYVRNGLINLLGINVTKDELRAELERQEQRYKDVYGGEITTYAAQPDPERKPWRKRATVQDQAFQQELQKIEQELKQEPAEQ